MQKTAQKRSVYNKLREFTNIPGAQLEKFFKPELARVMGDLKLADDNIRTLLTSQKIGKPNVAVPSGKPIKDLLKSARSNFNRREYMEGVADLGQFHKRFYEVAKIIDGLKLSVDKIHQAFLFQDLSEKQKKSIEDLREHMSNLAEVQSSQYFIKEAGFLDIIHNIWSKRGRSLAIWEKNNPRVAKELRSQGSRLIDHAEALSENTLSNLKAMASARATRQIDNYLEAANRIAADFKKFDLGDKGFRSYYDNVVKPALIEQDKIEKEQQKLQAPAVKVPDSKDLGNQEITTEESPAPKSAPTLFYGGDRGEYPAVPHLSVKQKIPPLPPVPTLQSPQKIPASPAVPKITEVEEPITSPQPPPPMSMSPASPPPRMSPQEMAQFEAQHGFGGSLAHSSFLESLEALSNEDPRIIASYISKYASMIKSKHPEKAIELFTIAKRLRG